MGVEGRVERSVISHSAADAQVAQFEGPHTIMLRPDATLWISEHFAGRIVALTIDQP